MTRSLGRLAGGVNLFVALGLLGLLGFWGTLAVTPANGTEPSAAVKASGVTSLTVFLVSYAAAAALFLGWLYRARTNLESSPGAANHWSAGWTLGAWFVPFANFVLGPLVLREVARDSLRPDDDRGRRALSVFVWVWVCSWLAGNLLATVAVARASADVRLTATEMLWLTVAGLVLAASAASLAVVVSRTTRAQHAQFEFPRVR
jgi:hypothetical protein